MKLTITSARITPHYGLKGVMTGAFSCTCGFTYIKRSLGDSAADPFRYHQVKAYGRVWEASLKTLWADRSISVRQIASKLGVAHNTVGRQATRLELPFPRKGPGPKVVKDRPELRRHFRRIRNEQSPSHRASLLRSYRKEWLAAQRENPQISRTQLQQETHPEAYRWLKRHDNAWLKSHMPPPYKRIGSARQVDWRSRDVLLAEEVRVSAAKLKRAPGRPVRVTRQAIGRDIDKLALITNPRSMKKIPLTVQALAEVVETRIEFALRRLRWAAELFRQEDVIPNLSTLAQRSGINWNIWYLPQVKAEIESVLSALREGNMDLRDEAA